jgi:signal transduction histidine kinase/DNA-binding response OmpR family regulator
MKNVFHDASIRIKLILIIGVSVLLALLVVASSITAFEYFSRRQQTEQALTAVGNIVAWNSSAALAFMDNNVAQKNLKMLETQPSIVAAFLYSPNGDIFAQYTTSYKVDEDFNRWIMIQWAKDDSPLALEKANNISTLERLKQWLKKKLGLSSIRPLQSGYSELTLYDKYGQIHLLKPIFIDDELIGILHIVDNQRNLNAFFSSFYSIMAAILLFTLLATMLVSARLQRIFSMPLLNLMLAMKKVAIEKNFTSQVTKTSNDEFGQLVDVYNDMISEIHQRDEQLDKQREGLEIQVEERTAQLTDINTALKQAVADALSAKEEAEAANRAKSQFLANMSHEIRTPMNAVLGMTDFLYESDLNSEQRHSIEIVQQSSRLLLGVINDILDFSKIESGKLELDTRPFDSYALINDSFALLETQAETKGLAYRLDVADIPAMLIGDSIKLSQILMNLLSNAVKFTAQGEVVLKVSSQALADNKVKLYFEVTDTGIGVDAEKQALIFDAFSQADNSMTRAFGGTGLGLAIAKQLVRLMRGDIGVNSQANQGAKFWFWVDLEKSELVSITSKVYTDCQFNARILVAEDYLANQILVTRFLENFGCCVKMVNNGLEAIDALTQQDYDLIFMDCQMPVMDGYQAASKIRRLENEASNSKHIPIIALTAHALAGDKAKCLAAGMDEWVTKPFTRKDLNEVLQKWLPEKDIIVGAIQTDKIAVSADAPAIDTNFLQQNFDFTNSDDLAFLADLQQVFQESTDKTLSALQYSIENRDSEQIRQLAHGLKSISSNVGAMQLSALCKTMEQAGKTQQLKDISVLLNNMKLEYAKALSGLNEILSRS